MHAAILSSSGGIVGIEMNASSTCSIAKGKSIRLRLIVSQIDGLLL